MKLPKQMGKAVVQNLLDEVKRKVREFGVEIEVERHEYYNSLLIRSSSFSTLRANALYTNGCFEMVQKHSIENYGVF